MEPAFAQRFTFVLFAGTRFFEGDNVIHAATVSALMKVSIDSAGNCTQNAAMENDYRIRFGTVGWQHPQWQQDYYPEELPQDWWLPFYSNEFPVVAVPAATWSDDPAAQINEWLENSDDHFRFIFEWQWQHGNDLREFCQRLAPLQDRSLGVLLQIAWPARGQQAELVSSLAEVSSSTTLCLEMMNEDYTLALTSLEANDAELTALLNAAQANCCWHGEETASELFFQARKLAVTKITDPAITPQQLRQVLETCSAQIQFHDAMVMLFDGQPPPLNKVQQAMVMLELLA
jgi:hypothetical protein